MGGGGGGGLAVLIYLPCWPFSLLSFFLLAKLMGGGGGSGPSPRSATEQSCSSVIIFNFVVFF